MTKDDRPIEFDLIQSGTCVGLHTCEAAIVPTPNAGDVHVGDNVKVRIEGWIGDADDAEFSALGLIYIFGLLSFVDAKPRSNVGVDYRNPDRWTAADMLRHIRFSRGELRFYADCVRGRMMKTTIVVRNDGTFLLETIDRGEAATRWLAKLQGKEPLVRLRCRRSMKAMLN